MSSPLLVVNGIEVIYNHVILVLKGVSLQVPEGGIVALLGGNGAGKTTTLRAICGMIRTEGEITLAGKRIDAMATLWRDAGIVDVETRLIEPVRSFVDFDEFWHVSTGTGSVRPTLAAMDQAERTHGQVSRGFRRQHAARAAQAHERGRRQRQHRKSWRAGGRQTNQH